MQEVIEALKITAAIFDMDGTVIDSMPIWNNLSYDFLTARGISPKPDLRDRVSTMFLRESSEYIVEEYSLDCTAQDVLDFMHARIDDFYINRVSPKQDIKPFLEMLRQKGIRLCVATATEMRLAVPALERNGMLGYFDKIFTCAEIGQSKRSPLIFEKALEYLGTDRESTVVFEDSLHAVETAARAAFPVVAIADDSSAHQREDIARLSRVFIGKYSELEGVLDFDT